MKFLVIVILIFSFCFGYSQNKVDSVELKRQTLFVDSITKKGLLQTFLQWSYEKRTAKNHDELIQVYREFISDKYKEFIKPK